MRSIWNKILILLILIFVSKFYALSQEKLNPNYTIIQNLSDEWQVFDEKYEGYIPYIKVRHQNPKTISFWLDLEKYKPYELIFWSSKIETYLFINNSLSKPLDKNEWITINLDSLAQKYKQNKKVFCTLYTPSISLPVPDIYIGQKKSLQITQEATQKQRDWFSVKAKPTSYKSDFVITILFFILLLYTVFYKNYPKELSEYVSLNYSRFRNDELGAVLKPFMTSYLLIILGHIFVVTFFYLFTQKSFTNIIHQNVFFLYKTENVIGLTINYILLLGVILIIFIAKYILLWLASNILNIDNIISIHFYEYLRLSYIFYSIVMMSLVLSYIVFYNIFPYIASSVIYILLTFHVLQAIITGFIISQKVEFKNLYLFYYLCITELTPILIGVKLLLFN